MIPPNAFLADEGSQNAASTGSQSRTAPRIRNGLRHRLPVEAGITRQLGVLAALLIACSAHAHHGLDFMVLQDGTIPKPGAFMMFDNTEWSTFNGEDEWGTEPGLHLGVTPWLALGTTASIMDEGNGWHYLSTTPYLNVPLFKSERVPWLKVSFYAGYEFPDNTAQSSASKASKKRTTTATSSSLSTLASSTTQATASSSPAKSLSKPPPSTTTTRSARHLTGGTVSGGGPDAPTGGTTQHDHPVASGPPAPSQNEEPTTSEPLPVIAVPMETPYLGIHRHGEEGLHARLIIDINLSDHDKLLANVINFTPAQGAPAWGYALGIRHAFNHDLATSLEAIGDFDGRGSHEVLLAVHRTLDHSLTLKFGAGIGLTPDSPDASIHAGIVWRF